MKKLILIIIIISATNIFASKRYCFNAITDIKSPELIKLFNQAEEAGKEENFKKANKILNTALSKKTLLEFTNRKSNAEPLELQIKTAIACYEFLEGQLTQFNNPKLENTFLDPLKKYEKVAKGKKWGSFTILRFRLIIYYIANQQFEKAEKEMNKFIDYDPLFIMPYLTWGLQINLPTAKANEKINAYLNKGGQFHYQIVLAQIQYKDRDGGNVFQDCIDFLEKYPTALPNELKEILGLFRKSLNLNNMNQVKEYYNAINRLAFEQPNTEKGMNLVSTILDEKKKVEMIFPDVKNNE